MKPIPVEVAEYLWRLDPEDRQALLPVFYAIHDVMPDGYELGLHLGMPCWVLPDRASADGTPLINVAITRGRVYLFGLSRDPGRWARLMQNHQMVGKPLQVAGSRVRFRAPEDLDLGVLGRSIASLSAPAFTALCTTPAITR